MKLGIMTAKTNAVEEEWKDYLYRQARQMVSNGFAFIAIDAVDVDEDLLGELVELVDCYEAHDEVFVELSNGQTLPISAFQMGGVY